ncbi:Arginase/deacetylase [Fistulina hepatica ATCC 64428]|uniref:Arginase/deacetylase n=1 Tax=Fistulina hepatica ATCC 64428 TaxID=1128425 RepID=A0A0D7APM0_9AGAR|nr:Arginase/deacetylase [Fistulina hepatica ATCC 64428]
MATSSLRVYLQNKCYSHRFIRSRDTSNVVERPERLRAFLVGLAAAIARLDDSKESTGATDVDNLISAINRMQIAGNSTVDLVNSNAVLDILNHAAVKFVHGDIDGDVYLENLKSWAAGSRDKIANGGIELPDGLPPGDLYLCPESIDAVQGALGTICEAVDTIMTSPPSKPSFVAIRPPGHHCGEDTPSGFCFVNNVIVAAAHAHLKHNVQRAVVFDIDLHHGNGTQALVWQINEETYRLALEAEAGTSAPRPGLQMFYGSLHDIMSYPCEDGKPELVQAASVSLHGGHGQHVENIHLQSYKTESEFWDLYDKVYSQLFTRASEFLDKTGGPGDDVIVFISCGFDACEHEYSSMSRHGRHVPVSFYERFARDARSFSAKYARAQDVKDVTCGRLISVLEGGYSDRAISSGAFAHLCGLTGAKADADWWTTERLVQLEQATKKQRGRKSQTDVRGNGKSAGDDAWLARVSAIFRTLEVDIPKPPPRVRAPVLPSSMTLRQRGKKEVVDSSASTASQSSTMPPAVAIASAQGEPGSEVGIDTDSLSSSSSSSLEVPVSRMTGPTNVPKKIPRVILRLGPRPEGQ